ncbi:LysM peptidoglycan-binding domain-containing protein [Streptomyces actuosus]|uniref:LysM peptidoglycan-binding domain-containing protein n=1 Tax=Streptomyces actuosus TaxID=1885 RepID=A0ABS2VSF8_STRAS|nr:transglycosylase family protein [Streptomyces actuosus]MBN0046016.1 LysM peptidoglycan-binding domain-containing protein [Streptomyces actuosus]
MLSGNGRHRRPRQAPALLVAAGVTGSAIAIPLLGATGASAADGGTWNKVADCETGGSWSLNVGNGFYGGLHLTLDDWEKYGGLEYAERPDLASRSQQIAVAERVLADQGVGAWPACGVLSGLTQGSGAAQVDTGVADDASGQTSGSSGSSKSSGSSVASDPTASPGSAGSTGSTGSSDSSGTSSSSGSSDSAASSGSSGVSASPEKPQPPNSSLPGGSSTAGPDDAGENSGAPGATPAPGGPAGAPSQGADSATTVAPDRDNSDNSPQPAGSSSLVDTGALGAGGQGAGRHRGGSADEGAAGGGAATASTGRHAVSGDGGDGAGGSYTVRAGDSLCSIADSLGVDGGWRRLYAENQDAIGVDPGHIVPGQTLRVGA